MEKYHYSPYGTVRSVPYINGDINEDGIVDISDFGWIAPKLGTVMGQDAAYSALGDFDRDGDIDVFDTGVVQGAFGYSAPAVPAGAISAFGNTVGYAGYVWEPNLGGGDSGMYQVRFRWYVPELGRFASSDPAHYVNGLNLFEYVGGYPLVFTDPLGLDWLDDTIDFGTGVTDSISGGLTRTIRDAVGLGVYVRYDSDAYLAGEVVGVVASFLPVVRVVTTAGELINLPFDLAQQYLQQNPGSYAAGYSCALTPGVPPPGTPGIYVFVDAFDPAGRHYVGQSKDISRRIRQHGDRVKPGTVEHDVVDGDTWERRSREQREMNKRGGKKNLTNKRNAVGKRFWKLIKGL